MTDTPKIAGQSVDLGLVNTDLSSYSSSRGPSRNPGLARTFPSTAAPHVPTDVEELEARSADLGARIEAARAKLRPSAEP